MIALRILFENIVLCLHPVITHFQDYTWDSDVRSALGRSVVTQQVSDDRKKNIVTTCWKPF